MSATMYGVVMFVTDELIEKSLVPLDQWCQWQADQHGAEHGYKAGPVQVRFADRDAIGDWPVQGWRKLAISWQVAT